MPRQRLLVLFALALAATVALKSQWAATLSGQNTAGGSPGDAKISFSKQVQPLLQSNCYGCHQPAKANGDFEMTSRQGLLKGGESGAPGIVSGKPQESHLLEMITPRDGKAEMPQGRPPLAASDIELVRRWIAEGAEDDSPKSKRPIVDADHPPVYSRGPIVTSLDFSPDGKLLAVAGFHEAILWKSDGSSRVARLVGMSDRIETVRFSADGTKLLVVGGNPCRNGEIQVWDVAAKNLVQSNVVSFDTLYGGSWSPDGKWIAVGAADNALRAFEAAGLRQIVYMAAHDDWIRGTVFSGDGKSIFTASRDMTVKMTDVATQRFAGNLTTHTPGILRGGMQAIDRHPKRNEVVVGGADGAPKLFKMDVQAAPAGGGNPNQIREYEAMPGRIYDVRFSSDGARFFAAGSLDGRSQIRCYETDSGKKLWQTEVPEAAIYSAAYSLAGGTATVAAAGSDGQVRLLDAAAGTIRKTFMPVDIAPPAQQAGNWFAGPDLTNTATTATASPLPAVTAATSAIAQLQVEPSSIRLEKPTDYVQLLATAIGPGSVRSDATRSVHWHVEGPVGQITAEGRFTPLASGRSRIVGTISGRRVEIPVEVSGAAADYVPSFTRDIAPVLSRAGCNAGTCHGSAKGKNGFKLSLRGYDPVFDHRALTDDLAARRINTASPDDSLMLLKPTAAVPHTGGRVFGTDTPYYRMLRRWIAAGAKQDLSAARVTKVEIFPQDPVIEAVGSAQQMRIVATYADSTTRDVTREAFIESGNTEVATADRQGVVSAVRRGEAPVLARYEGSYAATTLTVMGDRSGFVWQAPETWGKIDELVAAKWQRMKILPSEICGDAEFLRRVHLDLTGLPPTPAEVQAFLDDHRDTRTKRNAVIDRLIGSDDFIEHWTNKWADLLQVNRKHLGPEGAAALRQWIRGQLAANMPYNEFVWRIITASGSNRDNPPASYYKILREPTDTMEATTHLFMAVRFNCNKCHDHPFERWTQDQYYQTAAFFARIDLKPDPASGARKVGGTDVEGAKPLYEIVGDKAQGEVVHDRTKAVTAPKFPFAVDYPHHDSDTRREELAAWLTAAANPYFAKSYVNRLWGYLLGAGIIEPLDDIRAGNPPTNPELLDNLTREFIDHHFDMRHVLRLICRSRTYQLSIAVNRWNDDDKINYSHAMARRLPAEVLYDAVHRVTGSVSRIPGVPVGTRAAALPDSGVNLPDGFLTNLGRPARESVCECERSSGLQLGPVMALISGPTVEAAIADPQSELATLVATEKDDARLVAAIFLRVLNRPATPKEIEAGLAELRQLPGEHKLLTDRLEECSKQSAAASARQERERQKAMAQTRQVLEAYEKQIAPQLAAQERQRQEQISKAESALNEAEKGLPQRLAAWERQPQKRTTWTPLAASKLTSSNKCKLTQEADLSVFAAGPNGKTTYVFVAENDLPNVSGLRIEALADGRSPAKGPGRAPNGNFVLSQLVVDWHPLKEPKKKSRIKLENAQADYSQGGYEVQSAIGDSADRGWAVDGSEGRSHTAVFETREYIAPGILTIRMVQNFPDGQHTLGRFRISVTNSTRPITLDAQPQNIAEILMVAADKRTARQKAELLGYYRKTDSEWKRRSEALAMAKQPLPADPKLTQLRQALSEASRPVPADATLERLKSDVQQSAKQLQTVRLTFAQDLAWALINSPAFLFNH
jgi:WD40 repeat protein/mono/diheme cytochrome c family protein